MGLLKDASRIVNGVSLIAKEFVKDSQAFEAAKNGDIQNLIKKAVVSATDLSGLTKGRVRHLNGFMALSGATLQPPLLDQG